MYRAFIALFITLLLNAAIFGGAAAYFRGGKKEEPEDRPSNSRAIGEKSWRTNVICFLVLDCLCMMIAAACTSGIASMVVLTPVLWVLCGFIELKFISPRINAKIKTDYYKNK